MAAEWTPEMSVALAGAIREAAPELDNVAVGKVGRAVVNTLAAVQLIAAVPSPEKAEKVEAAKGKDQPAAGQHGHR